MQSSKNSTSKYNQLFFDKNASYNRPNQVKSTKNLNISLGANESLTTLNLHHIQPKPSYQFKNQLTRNIKIKSREQDNNSFNDIHYKLNMVARQNQKLKQQNGILKKQLSRMRKNNNDHYLIASKEKYRVLSRQHSKQREKVDLRGTIKKQIQDLGDSKELKIKLQILSKQCKMYQEIIDKMQNTIRRLTDQNKLLNSRKRPQDKFNEKDEHEGQGKHGHEIIFRPRVKNAFELVVMGDMEVAMDYLKKYLPQQNQTTINQAQIVKKLNSLIRTIKLRIESNTNY